MPMTPICSTAEFLAVGAASAAFAMTLDNGDFYQLTSTTAAWAKQSDAGSAASAATGNLYIPANVPVLLHGARGSKVTIIQASAGGSAVLVRVENQ